MTLSRTSRSPSLEDVLYAFSVEQRVPDAKLLDGFVRRYPQYAKELTDFAVALVLDALSDAPEDLEQFSKEAAAAASSSAVSRSVSRFHSKLHAVRTASKSSDDAEVSPEQANAPNPFETLSPEDLKAVADRLDATKIFVLRLRDRVIDPSTIPDKVIGMVAEALDATVESIVAHFGSSPEPLPAGAEFYKASKQPEVVKQQTFEQAVRASGLSEEQQKRFLSY